MKTILTFLFAVTSLSSFAQSIVLEDARDIFSTVTTQYVFNNGTGAAGIQTTYGYNDADSINDVYNFTIKGLSYNQQTEEIVFDNGVNEYVCARLEQKRFIFKYKTLVETGNCQIENKIYNRVVTQTDGINSRQIKVTNRRITFKVMNADRVETTNWNVQKWPTN